MPKRNKNAGLYFFAAAFMSLTIFAYASRIEFQDVKVAPGDTLWSIAEKYLRDPKKWPEILKYNNLPSSNSSMALPGMVLKVPVALLKEEYRAAKLKSYVNEVLLRKRNAVKWGGVSKNMDLYKNDALRTGINSSAEVTFYTGTGERLTEKTLSVYPNSMTILKPPKDVDIQLLSGSIRTKKATVITASARVTPKTRDTEYGAMIKDDLTTIVQVYKGKAQVDAGGESVIVPEGFASKVKFEQVPSAPVKLPPRPELAMANRPQKADWSVPAVKIKSNKVSLSVDRSKKKPSRKNVNVKIDLKSEEKNTLNVKEVISIPNPVQAYHIQIARDSSFSGIVYDRQHDVFDEVNLNEVLPEGIYWMRISYIDLLGFEGEFNKPRKLVVK